MKLKVIALYIMHSVSYDVARNDCCHDGILCSD